MAKADPMLLTHGMMYRAGVLFAALFLSGCSMGDLDGLFEYDRPTPVVAAVAEVPPPPPVDTQDNFCRGVARSDAFREARYGAGPEQQARISEASYADCMRRNPMALVQ